MGGTIDAIVTLAGGGSSGDGVKTRTHRAARAYLAQALPGDGQPQTGTTLSLVMENVSSTGESVSADAGVLTTLTLPGLSLASDPLAGLLALLRRAGAGRAIAVACDMPFVGAELLEALLRRAEAEDLEQAQQDAEGFAQGGRIGRTRGLETLRGVEQLHGARNHGVVLHALVVVVDLLEHAVHLPAQRLAGGRVERAHDHPVLLHHDLRGAERQKR